MFTPNDVPLFGITHPLGLPRPVDCENIFGAKIEFFSRNAMPVPYGSLGHFDTAVYRPYVRRLAAFLARREPGWSDAGVLDEPPRYCLFRNGRPAEVPGELEALLPQPPRVSLDAMFSHLDRCHTRAQPLQLLDILTLIREDAGLEKFSAAAAGHPWVAEFMR